MQQMNGAVEWILGGASAGMSAGLVASIIKGCFDSHLQGKDHRRQDVLRRNEAVSRFQCAAAIFEKRNSEDVKVEMTKSTSDLIKKFDPSVDSAARDLLERIQRGPGPPDNLDPEYLKRKESLIAAIDASMA